IPVLGAARSALVAVRPVLVDHPRPREARSRLGRQAADGLADAAARGSGLSVAASLAFLDLGTFRVHEDGRLIPIQGYVVRGGDRTVVPVDTGFPDVVRGFEHYGEPIEQHADVDELAKLGLAPGDLDLVVLTHSDVDHIGGIGAVSGVPIVMHRAERAL